MPGESKSAGRALLLPPTARDAKALSSLLGANGIACAVFPSLPALCASVEEGTGLLVVSEEAVTPDLPVLAACLRAQPVWSDLPVIVLARSGAESPSLARAVASLGNVSVLERPVRVTTLLSVVRSALRGRERQYEVRDRLVELARAAKALNTSEQRYRALATASSDLAYVMSGDWSVMQPLDGRGLVKSNAEPIRDWMQRNLPAAEHGRVREAIARVVAGKTLFELEHRVIRPDGSEGWTLSRAVPILDDGGEVIEWFGMASDITERKLAEAARDASLAAEREARAEAERAGQMKDEFLATLSHELRTPLNAILGWAQILAAGHPSHEELIDGLATIERNARVQTRIIEDLLDMSRIISGKVRLDVQRVDLASVVRAAVETVKPGADAKGVRLRAVLDPLAGPVSGDPSRLQQVFWNLLTNAVKFTPKGGQVQVLVERVNSHLEVSVIDTGEGIVPDFLPHVFDRFRQADASTTRRHGGLGLGLAIVKQLVELHGGNIRAKSGGTGMGSTFVVSIPLTVIHADPEPDPTPARRHPLAGPVPFPDRACADIAGVRVLVVDDEPDARSLVRRLLGDCGAVVTTAASAREALALIRAERPDVLVSDIGMPNEDGYALIRRVRSLGPDEGGDTPAIALTAYARSEDRMRAVMAGFQHHVVKPVEPAELITMVASLVTGKRP